MSFEKLLEDVGAGVLSPDRFLEELFKDPPVQERRSRIQPSIVSNSKQHKTPIYLPYRLNGLTKPKAQEVIDRTGFSFIEVTGVQLKEKHTRLTLDLQAYPEQTPLLIGEVLFELKEAFKHYREAQLLTLPQSSPLLTTLSTKVLTINTALRLEFFGLVEVLPTVQEEIDNGKFKGIRIITSDYYDGKTVVIVDIRSRASGLQISEIVFELRRLLKTPATELFQVYDNQGNALCALVTHLEENMENPYLVHHFP